MNIDSSELTREDEYVEVSTSCHVQTDEACAEEKATAKKPHTLSLILSVITLFILITSIVLAVIGVSLVNPSLLLICAALDIISFIISLLSIGFGAFRTILAIKGKKGAKEIILNAIGLSLGLENLVACFVVAIQLIITMLG